MPSSKLTRILTIMANCVFHFIILLSRRLHFNYNFKRYKKGDKAKRVDILFSSYLKNWRNYAHKNGKTYDYDLMIGDVIEEAEKDYNVYCLDNIITIRPKELTIKKFEQEDNWLCHEEFMTFKIIRKAIFHYFKNSLGHNNDPELDQFFSIIDKPPTIIGYLNLLIARKIIEDLNPQLVFMSCEYCYGHRELTYISRLMGKKTIALQHGEISTLYSKNYFFKDNRIMRALPDKLCVFGKEYYRFLTSESIFKPNMLAVTGNPRYDILYYLNNIYSKPELIGKYGIDPKKKIILWTTQTHGLTLEENRKNISTVFSTMKSLPNAQLIIKLHPGEDQEYPLYRRNNTYKPIVILGDEDTYGLIHLSDIVITRHSTTGLEAVALNKPLIVLNLSGTPDPVNYVKDGVAVGVYKPNELKSAIEKNLQEKMNFENERNNYIKKYLYQIDGKSAKRVLNVIQDVIKEKNNN